MYTNHLTPQQLLLLIASGDTPTCITADQLLGVELEIMDMVAEQIAGDSALVHWESSEEYH